MYLAYIVFTMLFRSFLALIWTPHMLESINTLVCIPLQHEKTTQGVANRTLPFQEKATQEKYTIVMSRFYGNGVTILIQIKLERNSLCLNNYK
jgi:hypothetical protein